MCYTSRVADSFNSGEVVYRAQTMEAQEDLSLEFLPELVELFRGKEEEISLAHDGIVTSLFG